MGRVKQVVLGMAGAGRGTELHMGGYSRVHGVDLRLKTILARRPEQLEPAKERYGFEQSTTSFDDLINDPEINLIDICTPPYAHFEMIKRALEAGKNVICEKPLTGYFGKEGDIYPIGRNVSKRVMYEHLLKELDEMQEIFDRCPGRFMYAENFVYAPSVQKAAEIVRAKKSRILFMKGEESLKGSSSPVAGEWSKTGGGTFIRTGSHPLSAVLWLKQVEAQAHGEHIEPVSVIADMARITPQLTDYEHRHIAARPNDVEDCGTVVITFSDGTKATVMATDTLLGGSRNYVQLYCNDAAINCNLTLANLMETYFLDENGLDNVYISEMLPSKMGWNNPFIEDESIRGYMAEIQDFVEAVAFDRAPASDFGLAKDTIKILYAAYLAAEEDKRIQL